MVFATGNRAASRDTPCDDVRHGDWDLCSCVQFRLESKFLRRSIACMHVSFGDPAIISMKDSHEMPASCGIRSLKRSSAYEPAVQALNLVECYYLMGAHEAWWSMWLSRVRL